MSDFGFNSVSGKRSTFYSSMGPGDQLDGYTLLRPIGRGGYGEVWLCRSDAVGDFRALKFISADSPELLEKEFHAVAHYRKAASKLRSPHLMPIEHAGRNADGLYYVMPLADGTGEDPTAPGWQPLTLGTLIGQRTSADTWFSCEEIAGWICPVLDALQTLANAGFVHRDVKPDNILILGGQPTLADISLLHEDSATITRRGTPGFLTPSWYTGGHPDMYGAAATLYTLLTGNQPDRMGRSAFNEPPQGEAALSAEERARRKHFHAVIRRATDERLGERYRDFPAMADALSPQKQKPSPWKNRVVTGAVLSSFLVLALAAFMTLTSSRKPGPPPPAAPAYEPEPRENAIDFPTAATKEAPFINSLGMKFVPVPGTDVLFCIHETRWKDYAEYAKANPGIATNWRGQHHRGFALTERPEDHPVCFLSWEDSQAFCKWLSEKEKKCYRLPTDREWSVAVGLEGKEKWHKGDLPCHAQGAPDEYPWGGGLPPPKGAGNYGDQSAKAKAPASYGFYLDDYDDGYPTTAPVMSFKPNDFGLYDMGGNVWEWVEDWWNETKTDRVLRGGCWYDFDRSGILLSSYRRQLRPDNRGNTHGFRVVLEVGASSTSPAQPPTPPQAAAKAPSLPAATKEVPFINSLGMKFVPVPGTDVLFCIHETRWKDYAEYFKANPGIGTNWQNQNFDGFSLTERNADHPVVNVSWEESTSFCRWLSSTEKIAYRLPTDREWSVAVGLGRKEPWRKGDTPESVSKDQYEFPWGTAWPPPQGAGNYSDQSRKTKAPRSGAEYLDGYDDGFPTTAPVMSFKPNEFGLYDMGGNAMEWVDDWWNAAKAEHVLRDRGWHHALRGGLLSAARINAWDHRDSYFGFRVVLVPPGSCEPTPASASPSSAPPQQAVVPEAPAPRPAVRETPFVNSLGMKFVPVPIGSGPTKGQRLLFSVWETRVQDYTVFAGETKRDWRTPGFQQTPTHPALCMSWEDACAFCSWLTERERQDGLLGANELYRLPRDHEWSCAAGIGDLEDPWLPPAKKAVMIESPETPWWEYPPSPQAGNYAGGELEPYLAAGTFSFIRSTIPGYRDGFVTTAPVGMFPPNELGLFDLRGNVAEWCEEWRDLNARVTRGGNWNNYQPGLLQLSARLGGGKGGDGVGFRAVLAPASTPAPPAGHDRP